MAANPANGLPATAEERAWVQEWAIRLRSNTADRNPRLRRDAQVCVLADGKARISSSVPFAAEVNGHLAAVAYRAASEQWALVEHIGGRDVIVHRIDGSLVRLYAADNRATAYMTDRCFAARHMVAVVVAPSSQPKAPIEVVLGETIQIPHSAGASACSVSGPLKHALLALEAGQDALSKFSRLSTRKAMELASTSAVVCRLRLEPGLLDHQPMFIAISNHHWLWGRREFILATNPFHGRIDQGWGPIR